MEEFDLPSGAKLKVQIAPFADARMLYQAILEEVRGIQISTSDMQNVFKDLACAGFSSRRIEAALELCFKRCLYNDLKIDKQTFEPIECRQDYVDVCLLVAKENVSPFMKSLYATFQQFTETKKESQA